MTTTGGITTVGYQALAGLCIADGTTSYIQANCYVGVGDDNSAFNAAQTNLNPTSGSYGTDRILVNATSVTRSGAQLTIVANFTTAQANFTNGWQEFGVFNSGTDGVGAMLIRQQQTLGTKTSSSTATLTITLTFASS